MRSSDICYYHPNQKSINACEKCGRSLCSLCLFQKKDTRISKSAGYQQVKSITINKCPICYFKKRKSLSIFNIIQMLFIIIATTITSIIGIRDNQLMLAIGLNITFWIYLIGLSYYEFKRKSKIRKDANLKLEKYQREFKLDKYFNKIPIQSDKINREV